MPTFKVEIERTRSEIQKATVEVWADSWADVQDAVNELAELDPEFLPVWFTKEHRDSEIRVVDFLERIPDPPA